MVSVVVVVVMVVRVGVVSVSGEWVGDIDIAHCFAVASSNSGFDSDYGFWHSSLILID